MKNSNIKVSIIVPAYNTAEYLPRCLDSLINQTLKGIEIIVVDNNSDDDGKTAGVIGAYVKKYPKLISSVFCEKRGASAARNMGIRQAKGEFVGFADSDDYCEPDMFERMYKASDGKEDTLVFCSLFIEDSNSQRIWQFCNIENHMDKTYILSVFGPYSVIIWRETMVRNELFFNENIIYEDTALMPTLVLFVKNIQRVERPLYHYIKREGSIMNPTSYDPRTNDIFEAMNDLKKAFVECDKFDYYHDEIEYIFIGSLLYNGDSYFSQHLKNCQKQTARVTEIMKSQFPKWYHNPYFLRRDLRFRVLCKLYYYRRFDLINKIIKIKRLLRGNK